MDDDIHLTQVLYIQEQHKYSPYAAITLSSVMCRICNVNYEVIIMITWWPECVMTAITDAAADNDDDEQNGHLCIPEIHTNNTA